MSKPEPAPSEEKPAANSRLARLRNTTIERLEALAAAEDLKTVDTAVNFALDHLEAARFSPAVSRARLSQQLEEVNRGLSLTAVLADRHLNLARRLEQGAISRVLTVSNLLAEEVRLVAKERASK